MFYIFCLSPALFGLGAVAMARANRHVEARMRRGRWVKFWSYCAVVHIVALTILTGSKALFVGVVIAVLILGGVELLAVDIHFRRNGIRRKSARVLTYLWFCVVSFGTFKFAQEIPTQAAIFVYLLVAAMDGFSQLTGQLFGRHKIAPKISPNKTVEGTLGGVSATLLLGTGLYWLMNLSPGVTAIYALGIALTAFAGDLTASWVKRTHGVKDFSNLLPGQGGVLDRFDSLLMVATVYWVCYHGPNWVHRLQFLHGWR